MSHTESWLTEKTIKKVSENTALDLTAPPDDDHPNRPATLLVECSRLAWNATPDDVHQANPQPEGPCTLATEARWLAHLWPAAAPHLTQADHQWIDHTTSTILNQLATATRTRPHPTHLCPHCGNRLAEAAGGWLWCHACGTEHPGPGRLAAQWRNRPEMSTAAIAAELHINPNRIHKWRHRGRIHPVRIDHGIAYWRPQEILNLLFPDTTT